MPRSIDRRGHLVPEDEFEEQKEAERRARIERFTRGAGVTVDSSRRVVPLESDDEPEWEPPSTRSHDPHTLEAFRAQYVEAMNSRS